MPTDTHPLLRSSRRRTLGALLSPTLVAATSCATDTGFGPDATPARIRYVNAVFVAGNPSDTAAGLSGPQFRTTTAVPIDVLVDLSTSAPSRLALAPNSVSSGTSVAAGAAGYADVPAGVRSFVARLASAVDPGTPPRIRTTSFYTNPVDSLPYLPRQTLTPGTPYTLVVAGQLPAPVVTATAPPPRTPAAAVPFVLLPDDPFTPPSAGGVLQARFRVINAAPYVTGTSAATGATLAVYLTPRGAAAPAGATLGTFTPAATPGAAFRGASAYVNAAAGSYTLTLATGTTIVYQAPLALAAGEVRSLVFLDAFATLPSALTPCVGDAACSFQVITLLDAKF